MNRKMKRHLIAGIQTEDEAHENVSVVIKNCLLKPQGGSLLLPDQQIASSSGAVPALSPRHDGEGWSKQALEGLWRASSEGILGHTEDEIVSCSFNTDTHSSTFAHFLV